MPVRPKQRHIANAPQEFYSLHVALANLRSHVKAVGHLYNNEITHPFPDRGTIYDLYDEIVSKQKTCLELEKQLETVSKKLEFTGNYLVDNVERKSVGRLDVPRRRYSCDGSDDQELPPTPSTPKKNKFDIWTAFRDAPLIPDDSPEKASKRVRFADLPSSPKQKTWLDRVIDKSINTVYGIASTPLLHAGWCVPPAIVAQAVTPNNRKRGCANDDYEQELSPTKKIKKLHSTPWPEAYTEELDLFEDCQENTSDDDEYHREPQSLAEDDQLFKKRSPLSRMDNTPSPRRRSNKKTTIGRARIHSFKLQD